MFNIKLIVYFIVLAFVLFALNGIDFNRFFKQNKVWEARILYIIVAFIITFLLVSFIFDFVEASKIL